MASNKSIYPVRNAYRVKPLESDNRSVKNLYSATEIARMRLPGLPTSKARIIDRAASEGWSFEERKGVGGTRRMYELPARYVQQAGMTTSQSTSGTTASMESPQPGKAARTAMGRDEMIIREIVIGVERFLGANPEVHLTPEDKSTLIAMLYRMVKEKGTSPKEVISSVAKAFGV